LGLSLITVFRSSGLYFLAAWKTHREEISPEGMPMYGGRRTRALKGADRVGLALVE